MDFAPECIVSSHTITQRFRFAFQLNNQAKTPNSEEYFENKVPSQNVDETKEKSGNETEYDLLFHIRISNRPATFAKG